MKAMLIGRNEDDHPAPALVLDMTEEQISAHQAACAAIRRELPKSTIWGRLVGLGLAQTAMTALLSDAVAYDRWFSPDWPNVYADDQGLLDFLRGPLALTEEQVAAVIAA